MSDGDCWIYEDPESLHFLKSGTSRSFMINDGEGIYIPRVHPRFWRCQKKDIRKDEVERKLEVDETRAEVNKNRVEVEVSKHEEKVNKGKDHNGLERMFINVINSIRETMTLHMLGPDCFKGMNEDASNFFYKI